jgi:tetratricopeptide (TPR) repeat protein
VIARRIPRPGSRSIARWARVAMSSGVLALAAVAQETPAEAPRTPSAPSEAVGMDERLQRWRESLALDLPGEVLAEGESAVAAGGAWSSDGRAVALVARALVAARPDGPEAALELLRRAKPGEATAADVELEIARARIASDDLAGALRALLATPDAAEPRFATRPEAWLLAGRAWARSGRPDRAAPFLARFLELAPRDPEAPSALHLLAQEALARRDGRTAQIAVRRAEELARWHALWKVRVLQVRESPDEPLPRLGLAQLWLQAAEPARAKSILAETCRRFPDFAAGWFHLGEAERRLGDHAAASAAYGRALEHEPGHLLARHNRGTIHRLEGRLAEARADFEAIVDGPRSTDDHALASHLWLSRVLDSLGEHEAAARRHARYLELGGREPLKTTTDDGGPAKGPAKGPTKGDR